ncbi:hypothetical protein HPB49_004158 [Dermacentor silvarum]|uniref:Uncharacterized protein n=1 Tax=Dermacentor silvarum TaxID=543639 RepID=A0ACB8CPQ5_DERSI|nr:hypothetical protein HPB49_004158 [Dermacentor silvarum]
MLPSCWDFTVGPHCIDVIEKLLLNIFFKIPQSRPRHAVMVWCAARVCGRKCLFKLEEREWGLEALVGHWRRFRLMLSFGDLDGWGKNIFTASSRSWLTDWPVFS